VESQGSLIDTFFMKLGITGKMVLILLASSILLIAAMALAMNWSFQKGFIDYLTEAELSRLDETAEKLANAYRREGSWDFIRGRHHIWAIYLPHNASDNSIAPSASPMSGDWQAGVARDTREWALPGGVAGVPPPPPNDRSGLSTRLRLLDAQRNNLIGPPDSSGRAFERAIELEGELIGWLSLTPQPLPSSGLEKSFRDEQLDALYPIALGALLLALLVGIPLGRYLLIPVKAVAKGANALAKGRFDTRLEPRSQDELGQLALDFNALAEALQRNELLRRQGMADISHELRTPLALLWGEIEAMQDGIRPTDPAQLGKLHESVLQFSRLVDDLYDLALTDAGALNYRKTSMNLADVLRDSAAAAEHRIAQQGLSLHSEIAKELPVLGDPRRLRQVVDNLLKNSRRYTDPGGEIRLSAWQTARRVWLKIEDSAPGVDGETLSRLFDRFYRAETSRARVSGGAGLGLAICSNIIQAHQGEILAKPSPLGGLQIVISLPMDESSALHN
jgi:two-component system sensor histidine kinase BaeS